MCSSIIASNDSPFMNIANIAAYRFVMLEELPELRAWFKQECLALALKGTILLAPEGINLFLSGTPENVKAFIRLLDADARFANMDFKQSASSKQPFNRMLVKLKKEIISMGMPQVSPAAQPAPSLAPGTLKAWLDEGRAVVLLDTRNEYEIRLGSFRNATHLSLDTFRAFPEQIGKLDPALKQTTVVTFCTGGIRCEKAAPVLLNAGFREVYQLAGGILNYFETVGGDHYDGDCFVFDRRVAVNAALEESGTVQCFNCLSPVSPAEQREKEYARDISCPHCATGKPKKRLAASLRDTAALSL